MPLLDPDRALLRIEVLQLQADCLGDPRAGVEARLANQQLWIIEASKHGGSLVIVKDAILADSPFPADLHPFHRIRERIRNDFPLLGAGEDAAHDIPQVDHHVPGRAFVLEPVEDFFRAELPEPRVLPPRQDVVIEPRAVLLARGRREFHLRIINVILAPQLRKLSEQDRATSTGWLAATAASHRVGAALSPAGICRARTRPAFLVRALSPLLGPIV